MMAGAAPPDDEPPTDHELERRRIAFVGALADRWQSDPDRFCGLLTADVVLVNAVGTRYVGRAAVRSAMEASADSPPPDVATTVEALDIRFLRRDVALMSTLKRVFVMDADGRLTSNRGSLTFVLVRDEGEWLIAAIQNTPIHGDLPRHEEWKTEHHLTNGDGASSLAHGMPVSGGRARMVARLRTRDALTVHADDAGDDVRARDA